MPLSWSWSCASVQRIQPTVEKGIFTKKKFPLNWGTGDSLHLYQTPILDERLVEMLVGDPTIEKNWHGVLPKNTCQTLVQAYSLACQKREWRNECVPSHWTIPGQALKIGACLIPMLTRTRAILLQSWPCDCKPYGWRAHPNPEAPFKISGSQIPPPM